MGQQTFTPHEMDPAKDSNSQRKDARLGCVLLGGHRWRREPVSRFAMKAGLKPILVTFKGEYVAPDLKKLVGPENVLTISTNDMTPVPPLASKLDSICPHGWYVVGLDDYVCRLAAELAIRSKARIYPPRSAAVTLHKDRLRARWNALCANSSQDPNLFPVPYRLIKFSNLQFTDRVRTVTASGFKPTHPLILKPNSLDASIGVRALETYGQLSEGLARLSRELLPLQAEVAAEGIPISSSVILEHQIPRARSLHAGDEFSAEYLTFRNPGSKPSHWLLGITQKYIDQRTFVEVGHAFPSTTFPPKLKQSLHLATVEMLNQLRVQFAISHWEYIVTTNHRLALVEAQLRPAGDRIMDLVRLSLGHNPYSLLFSALLDAGLTGAPPPPGKSAVVFFPQPAQTVASLLGWRLGPEAKKYLNKQLFQETELQTLEWWSPSVQWNTRHVSVVGVGKNIEEASAQAVDIISHAQLLYRTSGSKIKTCPLVIPEQCLT